MNVTTLCEIREYAQLIGRTFEPEKIILFGSYAHGTATADSDVDLLVLMKTRLHCVDQAVKIRAVAKFPFATDLIVRTPQQFKKRINMGDSFMRDIAETGLSLYEAHHA